MSESERWVGGWVEGPWGGKRWWEKFEEKKKSETSNRVVVASFLRSWLTGVRYQGPRVTEERACWAGGGGSGAGKGQTSEKTH